MSKRIAIITWSRRKVGGAEQYVESVVRELRRRQHQVGMWYEVDFPSDREPMNIAAIEPSYCVKAVGVSEAILGLREWQPDIIYSHGRLEPSFERQALTVAPGVFFAHNYDGLCVSGLRTNTFPIARPCERSFGPSCLLQYFPRRCGGLNPFTMFELFRRESVRRETLHGYHAIVTHSAHMVSEFVRSGFSADRLFRLPFGMFEDNALLAQDCGGKVREGERIDSEGSIQLLYVGRMEPLKGGALFLDALPVIHYRTRKRLNVVFAGDGSHRKEWEQKARRVSALCPAITVQFLGWIRQPNDLMKHSHVLVVPSIWPEPFGMVGPEAGIYGTPAVAFNVGGISDWLQPGINGHLAPGDPPTAEGLAEAICRCVSDPRAYSQLRHGATELARRYQMTAHVDSLVEVFSKIVGGSRN